jgi:glutamate carboxypeptidase
VVVHRRWNRPAKPATDPVRRLADQVRSITEDLGGSLPFTSTGGVCDGNILQAAGLPTLDTLGVCGGNLHRTDEYVDVESLVPRCCLLAVLLRRIATEDGG